MCRELQEYGQRATHGSGESWMDGRTDRHLRMALKRVGRTVTVHLVAKGGEGTDIRNVISFLLQWGEGVSWNCGLQGTHSTPTPPTVDVGGIIETAVLKYPQSRDLPCAEVPGQS